MGFSYIHIVVSEEAAKVALYGKREMNDAQEKEDDQPEWKAFAELSSASAFLSYLFIYFKNSH